MAATPPSIDIGILTIRPDEFRAVLDAFPSTAGVYKGRREYTLRYATTAGGSRYTLAVLRQIEQGNGEAQDAARDLLDDLNPSLLIVAGIAGGLPSDDLTLGDVVISTRVNDYSVEARKAKSEDTYSLSGGPLAKDIQARIANLEGRTRELGKWTKKLPARPAVSLKRADAFYGPKAWQAEVKEKLDAHFGRGASPRGPIFSAGPIASSDRLIKDPKVVIPWLRTARHLLAIEMESGGVYRAARDRCPMLAIRGISDIVGFKRHDAWTKYACATAAAFTRAFLRTEPVAPKAGSRAAKVRTPKPESASDEVPTESTRVFETIYSNLAPLKSYPKILYVAPATCVTYKQAWGRLRDGATSYVTQAWVLHDKNIYSFVDPSSGYLSRIVDTTAIESHDSTEWANATDRDQRRLFVQLLNGSLRDDLAIFGIWFAPDDKIFFFAGHAGEEPRKYKYKNVKLSSTMTVVPHYVHEAKNGTKSPYLRHLAFDGRFRSLGGRWFLEIVPTYRFTTDGRKKSWLHEYRLSGIKRLEGNRAVLSQVLVWSDVLCSRPAPNGPSRHLAFEPVATFEVERTIADEELTSVEATSGQTVPPSPSSSPERAAE